MVNPSQYCTVLNVLNVLSTDILGYIFWGTSVEYISDEDNDISAGIIYFLNKEEALKFDVGDQFLR